MTTMLMMVKYLTSRNGFDFSVADSDGMDGDLYHVVESCQPKENKRQSQENVTIAALKQSTLSKYMLDRKNLFNNQKKY